MLGAVGKRYFIGTCPRLPRSNGRYLQRFSFSTDTSASTTDNAPLPLFPWRHKPTPLPRLVKGTPEYTSLGPMITSIRKMVPGNSTLNSMATGYMFLDVPWYEILWLSHFEADLAENIAWAFTRGVGELLWSLPSPSSPPTPDDEDMHGGAATGEEVNFHRTINLIQAMAASVDMVGKHNDEECSSNNNSQRTSLQTMFHDKVLKHFQLAKDNALASLSRSLSSSTNSSDASAADDDAIEVRLHMKPYQSKLVSLYAIPYMSRKLAEDDPHYLTFYRNMLSKPSMDRAPDLSLLRQEYLDDQGKMESTVIAQVLVWCHEVFFVRHLPSGKILQGQEIMYQNGATGATAYGNGESESGNSSSGTQIRQQIPHLVRMEKTVLTVKDPLTGAFVNQQGNWIITDIDDLLGGNFVI